MTRPADIVLLCEDKQHVVFAQRWLKKMGRSHRLLRVEMAPEKTNAEQFVRMHFPDELSGHRKLRRGRKTLVVMTDGDAIGHEARKQRLEEECRTRKVPPRTKQDRVVILVPTWNIETWLKYLDGDDVDEKNKHSYCLKGRENECQRHVNALWDMCQKRQLRLPAPSALESACKEYDAHFA